MTRSQRVGLLLGLAGASALAVEACGSTDVIAPGTTSSASSTGGQSSSSGTGTGGTGGSTGGTGGVSSSSASSGGTGGAATGGGGAGGGGGAWPTCDAQPANVPLKTLHAIWQDDPVQPTAVWVPGVYVTAVSANGCSAAAACQIFVQQEESFPTVVAATQQSLRIFISPAAAEHFIGIKVGDRVDVYAHAWRYDLNGQNELLLQVSAALRGCAKVVGSGAPQPVEGLTLADLTVPAYESTLGPVLLKLNAVSGKTKTPTEIFGLWDASQGFDAGIENVTSLSPYFLPGSTFVGLMQDKVYDFQSITGVFGLFVPGAQPVVKYEVIYIRSMADVQ